MIELLPATRKSCLDHLIVCEAACCKMVRFKMTNRKFLRRGDRVAFKGGYESMTPDLKWYYELHGFEVVGDAVIAIIADRVQDGSTVTLHARCRALTADNRCSLHDTGKPKVCQLQTWDNPRPKGIFTPPKCMFKGAQSPKEE